MAVLNSSCLLDSIFLLLQSICIPFLVCMIFLVCVGGDLLYCCHFSHGDFQWSCSTKQHLPFASSALTAGLLEYKFAVFSH